MTAASGPAVPRLPIRSLLDPRTYQAEVRSAEDARRANVVLREITFTTGAIREIELRLPPEWNQ